MSSREQQLCSTEAWISLVKSRADSAFMRLEKLLYRRCKHRIPVYCQKGDGMHLTLKLYSFTDLLLFHNVLRIQQAEFVWDTLLALCSVLAGIAIEQFVMSASVSRGSEAAIYCELCKEYSERYDDGNTRVKTNSQVKYLHFGE